MPKKLGEKFCRVCEKVKSKNDFYKNKSYADGYASKCKECSRYYQRDREEHKKPEAISYQLQRKYGIDFETYNRMFDEQNGCCAICNTHQSELKKRLAVDHCHETGKVRALLCSPCNTSLGGFRDNTTLLQNAITYLNEHARSERDGA